MLSRTWTPALDWSSPLRAAALAVALGVVVGVGAALGSPLTSAAAVLGGALFLAIPRQPAVGLFALVALGYLLPFAVLPARIGLQLTALEALLGLTMAAVLLRACVRRDPLVRPGVVGWLLVAVLGLAALAFVLSLPYAGSLVEVGRRVAKMVLAMLSFPLTLHLVRTRRRLEALLVVVMVCGALEAAIAAGLYWAPRDTTVRLLSALGSLGYPTGPSVLRFIPGENDTYTDVLRATGTSIDPNVLGGALMLAAALQLTQLFSSRPLLGRWALAPLAGLTVYGMLLSNSRASWVGLAAGLLALATLRYRHLWLAIVPAAAAVALVPAGRALYGRVVSGFAAQDKAASMRLDEYRNALEIVQRHPLLGIGFGGPPTIDLAPGVSSLYLTVAETMGLPALALCLALWSVVLLRGLRALYAPLDPRLQGCLAGLLVAVTAALIAGLLDHYFAGTVFPHMVALFWLFWALLERAADLNQASCPRAATGLDGNAAGG